MNRFAYRLVFDTTNCVILVQSASFLLLNNSLLFIITRLFVIRFTIILYDQNEFSAVTEKIYRFCTNGIQPSLIALLLLSIEILEGRKMKIIDTPFTVLDWSEIASDSISGSIGICDWQTLETGNVRIRKVRYQPGFQADHFCKRGHVAHVLSGDLTIALNDGTIHLLQAGMSFVTADDEANPHAVSTINGATVFIVD